MIHLQNGFTTGAQQMHFYFYYILELLYNSGTGTIPTVDLIAQTETIKHKLCIHLWNDFLREFEDNNVHIFHYVGSCTAAV